MMAAGDWLPDEAGEEYMAAVRRLRTPDPQIFEDAIGQLWNGRGKVDYIFRQEFSCLAICNAHREGNFSSYETHAAQLYACRWFADDPVDDDPSIPEAHGSFPAHFTKSKVKRQYHRALWLTWLALMAEEGEEP